MWVAAEGERDEGTRGEMGCVGAGLGLEAAGPWRFSGPAWLDRPKRPAGLLFSLSYFLLTEKILERRKIKRGLGKEKCARG